jgi:hypothetical protein
MMHLLDDKRISSETLPNLVIIGAMKSGTTSLHHYLNSHSQISLSNPKELHFFVKEKNWVKGLEWYQSHFDAAALIRGETSPSYTAYPKWKGVPQRMYSVIPNAKLIYILRDPIERMISHYLNRYANAVENREINKALEDFNQDYVVRSHYYFQLEQYLEYYPSSSILIVTAEELSNFPQKTLPTIFRFLGVSDEIEAINYEKKRHKSTEKRRKNRLAEYLGLPPIVNKVDSSPSSAKDYIKKMLYLPFSQPIEKPVLNEDLHQRLTEHLKDDIDHLRQYTNRDFNEWCV